MKYGKTRAEKKMVLIAMKHARYEGYVRRERTRDTRVHEAREQEEHETRESGKHIEDVACQARNYVRNEALEAREHVRHEST